MREQAFRRALVEDISHVQGGNALGQGTARVAVHRGEQVHAGTCNRVTEVDVFVPISEVDYRSVVRRRCVWCRSLATAEHRIKRCRNRARDKWFASIAFVDAVAASHSRRAACSLAAFRTGGLTLGLRILSTMTSFVGLLGPVTSGGFHALADCVFSETPHEAFASFFTWLIDFLKGLYFCQFCLESHTAW